MHRKFHKQQGIDVYPPKNKRKATAQPQEPDTTARQRHISYNVTGSTKSIVVVPRAPHTTMAGPSTAAPIDNTIEASQPKSLDTTLTEDDIERDNDRDHQLEVNGLQQMITTTESNIKEKQKRKRTQGVRSVGFIHIDHK